MKLENKIAFVTGGGRSIGRAICLKLADEGADIVIANSSLEPANEVADLVRAKGRRCSVIQTDVTKYDRVKHAVAATREEFGRIDVLVNNAGGSARGKMSLFCDSEEETWDYVLNLNLKSVLYCCRQVIGGMLEQGSGSIINIGSVAGMIGLASQVDYSAAKAALIGFTRALAKETARSGVRVNCISCGPMASSAHKMSEEMRERTAKTALAEATGFGHFGEADDVAHLAAFLASDEAKFITGQNYPVCGLMNLGLNEPLLR